MYPVLGDFAVNSVVYLPFHTFSSVGASVAISSFTLSEVRVYKNGSITQRTSTAGITLLDTDGINFDGIAGIHGLKIDTSDNTDAGFWAASSEYMVVVGPITVDGQTVNLIAGTFAIRRLNGALAFADGTAGFVATKAVVDAILVDTGTTLDTKLNTIDDFIDTEVAAINTTLGAAGAGLTAVPWNAAWDPQVESEVADALVAIHLDHLLAVDYDPVSKPGVATALLNELVENDGGVSRYTANALEQAPTGGGGGSTDVLAAGTAQAGGANTITLQSDEPTTADLFNFNGIRITGGTGVGQSRQIIDYSTGRVATVNEPWIVAPNATSTYEIYSLGLNAATIAEVVTGVWGALRADHQIANSFGESVYADVLKISGDALAADNLEKMVDGTGLTLTGVVVPVVTTLTGHTNQTGDSFARLGAPTGASHSADRAAIKAETVLIVADTNELQTDWANGGRLDNILDARASQASVDTVDTVVDAILVDTGTTIDTALLAVKAKTDQITFTVAGFVDANSYRLNGNSVAGGGATPWSRG